MSVRQVIVCDGCGRQRGSAWRWIRYRIDLGAITFGHYEIGLWTGNHACGRKCANRALQRHRDGLRQPEAVGGSVAETGGAA